MSSKRPRKRILRKHVEQLPANQVILEMGNKVWLKNNWIKSYLRGRTPDLSLIPSLTLSNNTHVLSLWTKLFWKKFSAFKCLCGLIGPTWTIKGSLPQLKVLKLNHICKVPPLFLHEVTYLQVPRIRTETSLRSYYSAHPTDLRVGLPLEV